MSNPLSREARDAMRARVEKATPGPWAQGCWGRATNVGSLQEGVGLVCPCGAGEHAHADAEFIAAARSDVPTLLDALDAAEAERDKARGEHDALVDDFTELLARAERAEALVSTLGSACERFMADAEGGDMFINGVDDETFERFRAALASYQEWEREKAWTGKPQEVDVCPDCGRERHPFAFCAPTPGVEESPE